MTPMKLLSNLVVRCSFFAMTFCGGVPADSAFSAELPKKLPGLLKTHCLDCHNADLTEGELDLTPLLEDSMIAESRGRLIAKMRGRVEAGEMPPAVAGPLKKTEREHLLNQFSAEYRLVRDELKDDPGTVIVPRLTPAEYRNVIRDLSGGIVTNAGRFLPNEGGAGEGFSNVGAAQSMTTAQLEKYLDAAKEVLKHVRCYPTATGDVVWKSYPREPVHWPDAARKELTDEIIAWHVAQQQKWNEEHRENLNERLGFVHAAYLIAAWNYHHRKECPDSGSTFADFAECEGVPLAPVVLEKWYRILSADKPQEPFVKWAKAWQKLPAPGETNPKKLRQLCIAIEKGTSGLIAETDTEDYAPEYEISFHEAKEEVLAAAAKEGRWPFRIEIGEANELFLVVTDAGDGNRGEYAIWQRGRIVFKDGTSKPWEKVVTVVGANSGRKFPFGIDGEGSAKLPGDSIGVRPPGALKFAVPKDAIVFEVETALDTNRTKQASIQSLVLKKKPKSQSYVPGRYVFGGKKRQVKGNEENKELAKALRKRNVAEANLTKIGLNAERNVFADWKHTKLEHIGGPWPDQIADKEEPLFPYHLTVSQVRTNATQADRAVLTQLEDRLISIAQPAQQDLSALARTQQEKSAREGILPAENILARWPKPVREQARPLLHQIDEEEQHQTKIFSQLLEQFATRAWRRPVTTTELERLMSLYQNARSQGFSFDGSAKSSLLAVLASPHFLYRGFLKADSETGEATQPLSSYELASRLSFFLWASLPDDELLQLAAKDQLRDPEALRTQARRMLRDPKARSLATDFAGQLWSFADFENFNGPDAQRFPEFTPALQAAMREEVLLFLSDVFQNDRPLTNLLSADYTFANGELARHYGLEQPIAGETLQRVKLSAAHPRGGLVTMGLFLTKSSLPLRTSPVQRGVWVLEQVLGRDLPNPPADVQPLSEDDANAKGESILEQLKRHRAAASCAACHDKIDPLGISLENFDPIGRWREARRDGSELSTKTTLPDGGELDGSGGLKKHLLAHQEEFFQHFQRKLLGYALGRAVHPGDDFLLERMRQKQQKSGHRFSALVETIITSPQFLMRRTQGKNESS